MAGFPCQSFPEIIPTLFLWVGHDTSLLAVAERQEIGLPKLLDHIATAEPPVLPLPTADARRRYRLGMRARFRAKVHSRDRIQNDGDHRTALIGFQRRPTSRDDPPTQPRPRDLRFAKPPQAMTASQDRRQEMIAVGNVAWANKTGRRCNIGVTRSPLHWCWVKIGDHASTAQEQAADRAVNPPPRIGTASALPCHFRAVYPQFCYTIVTRTHNINEKWLTANVNIRPTRWVSYPSSPE